MRKAIFFLLLVVSSGVLAQDKQRMYDGNSPGFSLTKAEVEDLDYEGNPIEAYRWNDKSGENRLLLTRSSSKLYEAPSDEYPESSYSQYLYAYHYRIVRGGKKVLVRRIMDFVRGCPFDMKVAFVPGSLSFTDLDEDDLLEVCFQYRLACRSDFSTSTQKLMLLEDGDKYALRGSSVLGMIPADQRDAYDPDMGNYRVDPAYETAPRQFLSYSKEQWEKHKFEMKF